EYFGNMGRPWGDAALVDQQTAGGIAWGLGEFPTLLIAMGVTYMWVKSDARETRRKDRAADRNKDAELGAYNDMFAQLAARDAAMAKSTPGPALPHLHHSKPGPGVGGATEGSATQNSSTADSNASEPGIPAGKQGEAH